MMIPETLPTGAGMARAASKISFLPLKDRTKTARLMPGSFLIPDLLEQYMKERGYTERWVTVQELRTCVQQDCPSGQAISGFLGRNHNGAFAACRYRVTRVEKFRDTTPPYRVIKRYLVQERPAWQHHARQAYISKNNPSR